MNHYNSCFSSRLLVNILLYILVPMVLVSSAIFPLLFVFGLHLINPFKPSLVGYFVLPECHHGLHSQISVVQIMLGFFVKAAAFVGNKWVWFFFGAHGVVFVIVTVHIICTLMPFDNLRFFWERLRCSKNIFQDIRIWRQLQILSTLCNYVQQSYLCVFIMGINYKFHSCNELKCINSTSLWYQ